MAQPRAARRADRTGRLWVVLGLNLALVVALVAVGVGARSIGVLAEGCDYLADAAGVGVALYAIRISRRLGGGSKATTVAAAVNAGWLLVLQLVVGAGALDRLARGTRPVHGLAVLVVSGVAALVMLAGAVVLGGDDAHDDDLNFRAVLLDTAADAAAAGGVALGGAVILATGGTYWVDPAVALCVAAVVSWHATRLLAEVARRLHRD